MPDTRPISANFLRGYISTTKVSWKEKARAWQGQVRSLHTDKIVPFQHLDYPL